MNMKNLGKLLSFEQIKLLFSLFVAQNSDMRISEFVNGYDEFCEKEDIVNLRTLSDLLLVNNGVRYGLGFNLDGLFYGLIEFHKMTRSVVVYNFRNSPGLKFEHFDIMKHISFEDKV